jgi:hypothetical protein
VKRARVWLAPPLCLLAVSLGGCDPLNFASEAAGARLGHDLAEAHHIEGRSECTLYSPDRDLWQCRVEGDPGSGWSGSLLLKLGKNGCWRARHVRYEKNRGSMARQSDLVIGNFQPHGKTFRGCTDIDG